MGTRQAKIDDKEVSIKFNMSEGVPKITDKACANSRDYLYRALKKCFSLLLLNFKRENFVKVKLIS